MAAHSSKIHAGLERVPGKQNWVDHAGGLPNYIERIAKHIHADSGYTISHAIASAVNRVKKLIATGSPATKAKATKALAQWEAKKRRGKKNLTDAELIEEVVINMAEAPASKEGSKSSGVTDKKKLAAAIALYRSKKSSYTPEQRAKIEARLKSSQQRLGVKVGLSDDNVDLTQKVFFKNRRTPEIVNDGATPKKGGAGTKAGKVVARKKVTEEDKKKMKGGRWLREDKSGKKPGDKGYLSGPSKGPDAKKKRSTKNLSEQVELFKRNQHRLDLTQRETAIKYLEAQASQSGVTINLSGQPVGVTIARKTGFNPTKHNRGFGGRFAPKAQ